MVALMSLGVYTSHVFGLELPSNFSPAQILALSDF